jgi:hypothetical protein
MHGVDLLLPDDTKESGLKNAVDVHEEEVLRQWSYLRQLCRKGCAGGWLPWRIMNNRIRIVDVKEDLWSRCWEVLTVLQVT